MKKVLCFLFFIIIISIPESLCSQSSGYKILKKIKIGGEGGWDYCTVDTMNHRLYASRGTRVLVIDTDRDTLIGEIPNTQGVHGIALASNLKKGYTSNGRDSSVTVFDLLSNTVIGSIKMKARNPDAIAYDPATQRVF